MPDNPPSSSPSIGPEECVPVPDSDTSELEHANFLLKQDVDELRRKNANLERQYDELCRNFQALQRNFEEQKKHLEEETTRSRNMVLYMEDRINQLTRREIPVIQKEISSSVGSAIREEIEQKMTNLNSRIRNEVESNATELREELQKGLSESTVRTNDAIDIASKRIDEVEFGLNDIFKRQSASEIDIWNVNQKLSRGKTIKQLLASGYLTTAFYKDGYEIFMHSPSFANLCSKKFYPHTIEGEIKYAGISPNTTTLIYSKKSQESTVVVFDLNSARPLYEIQLDSEVLSITANSNYFVVSVAGKKSFLYRVNDTKRRPIAEFPRPFAYPRLSSNDILVFQEERNTVLCFYNVNTRTRMESIDVGFVFSHIRSTSTGTIVAVRDYGNGLFKMFDVESRQQIFEIEKTGFGWLLEKAISHDDKHIAFWSNEQITILSLNIEDDGRRTLNFTFNIDYDGMFMFEWYPVFRKINGVDHFQYITYGSVLKLYKLNETDKRWDLVE